MSKLGMAKVSGLPCFRKHSPHLSIYQTVQGLSSARIRCSDVETGHALSHFEAGQTPQVDSGARSHSGRNVKSSSMLYQSSNLELEGVVTPRAATLQCRV